MTETIRELVPLIFFFILLDFGKKKRPHKMAIVAVAGLAVAVSFLTKISVGTVLYVMYTCYWGFRKQAKLAEADDKRPWRMVGTGIAAVLAAVVLAVGLPQDMSQPERVILVIVLALLLPPVLGMWASAAWLARKKTQKAKEGDDFL